MPNLSVMLDAAYSTILSLDAVVPTENGCFDSTYLSIP